MTKYTLVQHTGFSGKRDPDFKQAAELRSITSASQVSKVLAKGGVVYSSYTDARNAEHAYNYPANHPGGIIPAARGKFSWVASVGESVFIPEVYNVGAED